MNYLNSLTFSNQIVYTFPTKHYRSYNIVIDATELSRHWNFRNLRLQLMNKDRPYSYNCAECLANRLKIDTRKLTYTEKLDALN